MSVCCSNPRSTTAKIQTAKNASHFTERPLITVVTLCVLSLEAREVFIPLVWFLISASLKVRTRTESDRMRTFLKTPVVFSSFSLLSLERSSLEVFGGVQDVIHLVFHVSIKWEAALLVHHFIVRQRLIESQPLVDFLSVSFNYSVCPRSWPTSSPRCFPLALQVGRPISKAREKRPGDEVGSWLCKLILLYSEGAK